MESATLKKKRKKRKEIIINKIKEDKVNSKQKHIAHTKIANQKQKSRNHINEIQEWLSKEIINQEIA